MIPKSCADSASTSLLLIFSLIHSNLVSVSAHMGTIPVRTSIISIWENTMVSSQSHYLISWNIWHFLLISLFWTVFHLVFMSTNFLDHLPTSLAISWSPWLYTLLVSLIPTSFSVPDLSSLLSFLYVLTPWMSSFSSMALNMIHMLRTQKGTPVVLSIILVYPTTSNSLHEDLSEATCDIVCHLLYNTATKREFSNTCFKVKTVTLIRTVHYSCFITERPFSRGSSYKHFSYL